MSTQDFSNTETADDTRTPPVVEKRIVRARNWIERLNLDLKSIDGLTYAEWTLFINKDVSWCDGLNNAEYTYTINGVDLTFTGFYNYEIVMDETLPDEDAVIFKLREIHRSYARECMPITSLLFENGKLTLEFCNELK